MSHLPNGVYRISHYGSHGQPQILTAENEEVTVLPPGTGPPGAQEWQVENLKNGEVAIQHPIKRWPSRSLSYEGEPEAGKRVILGPVSDFPTREWRVEIAPQKPHPTPYFIRVPSKDLIVVISPLKIFPPLIVLGEADNKLEDAWSFERLDSD